MAPEVEADRLVRRTPFSANPTVGPRGQRTQQRILDAALQVFGDEGYYGASIERITTRAGCSRVSFYQYFAAKDDVFGQLAAQVARQVVAATDGLGSVTPDAAGRASLHAWIVRYAEIYTRSAAVFRVFDSSAESASAVASLRATAGEQAVARIRSKLDVGGLPSRELHAVITLLLDSIGRTLHLAELLRTVVPAAAPPDRLHDALADGIHRTLFGRVRGVNDSGRARRTPLVPFSPSMQAMVVAPSEPPPAAASGTLDTLLVAGREVLSDRGYHATRVDDVVAAAGLSHGVFYRYFTNLAQFALVLVRQAMLPVAVALEAIPSGDSSTLTRSELRRWLRDYNTVHSDQAAMIRVWVDASLHDAELGVDSAPAVDWGRRKLQRFLAPRGFGDVALEALVMMALLEAFGAHPRSADVIDSVAHVIERGLLGQPL